MACQFAPVSQGYRPVAGLCFVRIGALVASGREASSVTYFSGAGVPSTSLGQPGDMYLRADTPTTVNQRICIKTNSITWTGIL